MKNETRAVVPMEKSRITAVLMGVLIAYAITCIFFIGCALALTYSTLTEEMVPTIMLVAVAVSVIVAGFDAAKGADKRGWMWGMAAGLLYALILICIETWVSSKFTVDAKTMTSVALSVVGGGFGGIMGINFGRRK